MDEQLTHLRSLLDSLSDPLKKVDEQAEKQLVQLATMLSEAIIYQEIKTSPDIILHTLKKSIDALNAEQQKVKIHLHPEDLTLIKTSYGEQAIEDNHWQLIPEINNSGNDLFDIKRLFKIGSDDAVQLLRSKVISLNTSHLKIS